MCIRDSPRGHGGRAAAQGARPVGLAERPEQPAAAGAREGVEALVRPLRARPAAAERRERPGGRAARVRAGLAARGARPDAADRRARPGARAAAPRRRGRRGPDVARVLDELRALVAARARAAAAEAARGAAGLRLGRG